MNRTDAVRVIKNLQNKPFICGENEILVNGGYVIIRKEQYEMLRKEKAQKRKIDNLSI